MLLVVWWLHLLHAPISDFVGRHFPFAHKGSPLVLPVVAVQVVLIEALVCLPVSALLVVALRSEATTVAVALACVFALRVLVEVLDQDYGRGRQLLALFHVTAHTILLVAGAIYLKRWVPALERHRP